MYALVYPARSPVVKRRPVPSRGGLAPPPDPSLLFGKMAPATLEISIFSGNLLKMLPPRGVAEGGDRRYFQRISADN